MKPTLNLAFASLIVATSMAATPAAHSAKATPVVKSVEARVLKLTNIERKKRGCKPLKTNKNLRKAARKHSKKMARANKMSHQLPGEKTLGKRITAAGYKNWRMVGENVAYGYPSAKSVVTAWMNSPGHRRNILNCSYRHLGVGVVNSNGVYWYTQNFGRK